MRRKFVEAEPHYPETAEMLEKIGRLYAIEREIRAVPEPEREAFARARRGSDSAAIVREIHAWLLSRRALPRSALGKAIAYTAGIWPGLCRFLDDPRIPIDNNGTERGMRALVIGVSLCSTSSSTWNRKSAIIARNATRALDRPAIRERTLHRGRL